jgi:soluble lytic murein transglycosylase-like protein
MGPLTRITLAAILLIAVPARADPVARWQPIITEASLRFGIPERWIVRVMRAESGGQTMRDGKPTTSRAGAMGLMQLMPATWAAMRASLGLGVDPHDPHDNIIAGTAYLRLMYGRFGYPGLFAAYNAGPGRYAEHLANGRALPGETRAYLATVTGQGSNANKASTMTPVPAIDRLFVVQRAASTDVQMRGTDKRSEDKSRLFVMLSPR